MRSHFDLVRVEIEIAVLGLGICDRSLIWLGWKMRSTELPQSSLHE